VSAHLALLDIQFDHIVMVPESLCSLGISGLGSSLIAGDLVLREMKTLIKHSSLWSTLAGFERHASE
jgi:hypothetical protein